MFKIEQIANGWNERTAWTLNIFMLEIKAFAINRNRCQRECVRVCVYGNQQLAYKQHHGTARANKLENHKFLFDFQIWLSRRECGQRQMWHITQSSVCWSLVWEERFVVRHRHCHTIPTMNPEPSISTGAPTPNWTRIKCAYERIVRDHSDIHLEMFVQIKCLIKSMNKIRLKRSQYLCYFGFNFGRTRKTITIMQLRMLNAYITLTNDITVVARVPAKWRRKWQRRMSEECALRMRGYTINSRSSSTRAYDCFSSFTDMMRWLTKSGGRRCVCANMRTPNV